MWHFSLNSFGQSNHLHVHLLRLQIKRRKYTVFLAPSSFFKPQVQNTTMLKKEKKGAFSKKDCDGGMGKSGTGPCVFNSLLQLFQQRARAVTY